MAPGLRACPASLLSARKVSWKRKLWVSNPISHRVWECKQKLSSQGPLCSVWQMLFHIDPDQHFSSAVGIYHPQRWLERARTVHWSYWNSNQNWFKFCFPLLQSIASCFVIFKNQKYKERSTCKLIFLTFLIKNCYFVLRKKSS